MNVSELSGQTVGDGRYRLLVRLGNGNFGTVYRAQELMGSQTVREVALKLYSPEATKAGNVEGMLQDCALPARIMASDAPIEHKRHFVSIYSWNWCGEATRWRTSSSAAGGQSIFPANR